MALKKRIISMVLTAALLFFETVVPVGAAEPTPNTMNVQGETAAETTGTVQQDERKEPGNAGDTTSPASEYTEEEYIEEPVTQLMIPIEDETQIIEPYSEAAEPVSKSVSELTATVSYPAQIKCGEPTTFTVNAAGGWGNYRDRLHSLIIHDGNEWVSVYDVSYGNNSVYQESNEFQFTFYASGTYYIRFDVFDKSPDINPETNTNYVKYANTGWMKHKLVIQDPAYPSVEQIVNNLAAQCNKECSGDYEKALWLHDWIIENAKYDYSYAYCSAEGVLARGVGTCESYHRAYVMLLNKVGIPTGRITGNGHVWTAVKMDGEWYQVDTTWDGSISPQEKEKDYDHMYFGLTDEIMGLVHSDHKAPVPGYESAALKNNYFIKTGKIRRWSDQFIEPIKEKIAEGKREFTLPVTDNSPDNYKNVFYNLAAYQLSAQAWGDMKVSASYKDNVMTVRTEKDLGSLHSLLITPPTKTTYTKGEAVSTAGLTVTAIYANGSKVLTEKEYQLSGFDANTVGTHTAIVSYKGKNASFDYSVQPVPTGGGNNGNNSDNTMDGSTENKPVNISYRTHVQSYGWQKFAENGSMSGTSGESKRLEGIEIKLNTDADIGIQYTTHCQTYGWLPWSANGQMNGTTGESKRLEAIKIQLTGTDKDKYDVYYRVHAQTYGWLNWSKNGAAAGTAGYGKRLEGIQIIIVPRNQSFEHHLQGIISKRDESFLAKTGGEPSVNGAEKPNTMYRTHVQTYGWQGWKYNGQMSGTSGKSKRLEGIELQLTNQPYGGDILYRTHIQTHGWQGWKSNGQMSGTSGKSKRLEAIEIKLTGTMAQKYDIYYRVHAQNFGWMGWAKNGEPAGSAGYSYRLEGIEIRLVPKGAKAPGSTVNAYKQHAVRNQSAYN